MNSGQDYRAAIAAYIRRNAIPVDKFGHQPRLYSLCGRVGAGQVYDDDVVFAAAWLHDLGVFVGHRPENIEELTVWDNVAYACEKAPGVLANCGFPCEKAPAVVEAIRTHQPSASPRTLEGTILRDADILEQLGAIAVLRTAAKIGRDTRYSVFADLVPVLESALRNLPSQLALDAARQLAIPRVAVLHDFLVALAAETSAG